MSASPLLSVQALDAYYGDFQALFGVDLEVGAGETVALIGANGAGKSTLLKSLLGMVRIGAGRVWFDGEDVTGQPAHRAAGRGIAISPEGRRLFPSLTVEENLIAGRGRAARHWSLAAVYELFPALHERRAAPATLLSGGQQQMVAIGRALLLEPRLLLLDEISLGLSPAVVGEVYQCLQRIAATGVSVVLVEQDIGLALQASRRAVVLREGRVALSEPSAGLARERVSHAYFG